MQGGRGEASGKRHQWIIYEREPNATPIDVSEESVRLHKEAGLLDWLKWRSHFPKGIPCFFSEFGNSVWFGPTRNFKVPYQVTTEEANLWKRTKPVAGWDLAQSIFGRLKDDSQSGARSRVFFEDAFLESGDVSRTKEVHAVFGQPKPTTFQHYLQQPRNRGDCIPWSKDGQPPDAAKLRGVKMYWRRKKLIPIPDKPEAKPEQKSIFSYIQVNHVDRPTFGAKIRFENLTSVELGALLCALHLPTGLRHQIGLAKPYGLGTIHIEVEKVLKTDHNARYGAFLIAVPKPSNQELRLDEAEGDLAHGLQKVDPKQFEEEFSRAWHGTNSVEQMWQTPRFQELAALLEWDNLPQDADVWNNMTRYLEFGKFENGKDYSEYLKPSRRRPLPLASEVLKDGRLTTHGILPRDPRPRFVEAERAAASPGPAGPTRDTLARAELGPRSQKDRSRNRRSRRPR